MDEKRGSFMNLDYLNTLPGLNNEQGFELLILKRIL